MNAKSSGHRLKCKSNRRTFRNGLSFSPPSTQVFPMPPLVRPICVPGHESPAHCLTSPPTTPRNTATGSAQVSPVLEARSDSAAPFVACLPTVAHRAIVALVNAGWVHYVVSQNVDGLHLRSGLGRELLSELHGDFFVQRCDRCAAEVSAHSDPSRPPLPCTSSLPLSNRPFRYRRLPRLGSDPSRYTLTRIFILAS